jgi:hypothetical protein
MDMILHTAIAMGCMAGFYYLGRILAKKYWLDNIVSGLLEKLENDGFIHTVTDKDGEKEIIPISELVAKALREAKSQKNII